MNIWTLGDAVVDLLPLADMQFRACAGGAPFNVAIGTARLKCRTGFIGRVGDDDFGHFLRKTLEDSRVSTQCIQMDKHHRTSTVLVSLKDQGERGFTFLTNPSADQFLTQDALPAFGDDILHFCSLALVATDCRTTLTKAVQEVIDHGGLVSFDVNLREQMWRDKEEMFTTVSQFAEKADILKLSEEEWYWLIGTHDYTEALEALKTHPARLKVVTFGARGSLVLWQDMVIHFRGFNVKSIDTTCAGDAFMAGLLASIAHKGLPMNFPELQLAITQASATGALATTKKGALTALPDTAALEKFINHFPLPGYEILGATATV
ncbi:aminoimidazole riboside kinase [Enterobacter sp. JBIWA008]|uniref:aminoimidazole riboside kinase n=1 Tax=Enterobacter sp. JBIWA008 TaxID=2831892 RepID=UPI001CBE8D00|nr:aminoimidazole riboside kinase [Enterobacter sp. JBIWA008]UAN42252.1 aminoimidazole riboside kinase [Enterobacter sp. JBIWA008]